jgi:membrane dipeptidase
MIQFYYDLGVRQIHLACHRRNGVTCGCYESDALLTALSVGQEPPADRAGSGPLAYDERSALNIMKIAEQSLVFSHSNPRTLNPNHRNITDATIDA